MLQALAAKINLANIRHNTQVLRGLLGPKSFFCPMVKANAYGHGDIEVSKALLAAGVRTLGVARIEEGVRLREANLDKCEILVFDPYIDVLAAKSIVNYELTSVVSSWQSLQCLESVSSGFQAVHLKFNTGMNRLGFSVSESDKLANYLQKSDKLKLSGICSHLLSGEDWGANDSRTQGQYQMFQELARKFHVPDIHAHLWNSAGLISYKAHGDQCDAIGARPGLSIYGIKPEIITKNESALHFWQKLDLRPVMQVHSVIAHTQNLKRGETVSYGGRYTATRDSVAAVIPMGYADGYTRHFSSRGEMLIRGLKQPVLGTVCMDFTMVDVTDINAKSTVSPGEPVVILGSQGDFEITARDLAKMIQTNEYEILTNISARVPREYYD